MSDEKVLYCWQHAWSYYSGPPFTQSECAFHSNRITSLLLGPSDAYKCTSCAEQINMRCNMLFREAGKRERELQVSLGHVKEGQVKPQTGLPVQIQMRSPRIGRAYACSQVHSQDQ